MESDLKDPVVYVSRDIERALGMEPKGAFFVVSNDTKYGREIRKKYPENIKLMKDPRGILDTYDLLLLQDAQKFISGHKASVLVFQNTFRIERLAKEKGWRLLNPPAKLSKKVEEKISQMEWLGKDICLLPPSKTAVLKNVRFTGKKFVIQFNHAHTGEGTFIIDQAAKLENLRKKFPNREIRISDFIDGPVFTVNAMAAKDEVLVGNPSYQITGIKPFTDLPFSTIGNDFALTHLAKYKKVRQASVVMASKIGKKLAGDGWRGLFGIDVIHDEKTEKSYLLEINARQPASTVFESKLQKEKNPKGLAIFEAHVAILLDKPVKGDLVKIKDGAQIVKRVTEKKSGVNAAALRENFEVMEYQNDIYNKELFRIQSGKGIMKSHNRLNDLGNSIKSCIL